MGRQRGRGIEDLKGFLQRAGPLTPGLTDAALSSLAGFAASLYAVRTFEPSELGAYAVYIAAYIVAGLFAQQLIFLPAQIASLRVPRADRAFILPPTLRLGAAVSVPAAPFAAAAGLLLGGQVAGATLFALATGAAALTVLAPMQDHARSTLHLCGLHGKAAAMSGVQLGGTLAALAVLDAAGVAAAWTPLSALAAGSLVSMAWGLRAAPRPAAAIDLPDARDLMAAGRPLLPSALLQEATLLATAALLASTASAAALGSAEAARVVARPVQTLSLGISRALAPALMEAGEARSRSRSRSPALLYAATLVAGGVAYLAIAGWAYPHSPFEALAPAAYVDNGLVALFIVATVAGAVLQLPRAILLGAGRGPDILRMTAVASVLRLAAIAALAGAVGAYALPLAHLVSLVAIATMGWRALQHTLDRP